MKPSTHSTVASLLMFCAGLLAPIVASGAEQESCGSRVATLLGIEQWSDEDRRTSDALPSIHPQYHIQIAADAEHNPVRSGKMTFMVSGVPAAATVGCWKLRMYRESSQQWRISAQTKKVELDSTKAPQQVQIFPYRPSTHSTYFWSENDLKAIGPGQAISATEVGPEASRAEFPRRVRDDWEKAAWTKAITSNNVDLDVEARSTSRSQLYTYFRSGVVESDCASGGKTLPCFNVQPRLVVEYTPVLSVPTFDWPQPGFDAQHSGRSQWGVWEYGALPMAFGQLTTTPLYIRSDPVLYQGQLIVPVETKDEKRFFIIAIGSTGEELWRVPLDSAIDQPPIVDRQGVLHIFTADELVTLDLEAASKKPQPRSWQRTIIQTTDPVFALTAPPTMGYNGALYLPTNKGVYALTPGRQVFWQYPMKNGCPGKVALSADEAIAYFVDGKTGELIAVDNTDGSILGENKRTWSSSGLIQYQDAAKPCTREQRFPVVGKDAIYVTDGYPAGPALHRFEAVGGKRCDVARGQAGEKEAVSIPVVGQDGRLFFVMSVPTSALVGQDGRPVFVKSGAGLCAYDPIKRGAGNPLECRPVTPKEMFSPHTRLVLDGSGTLFAVDPIAVEDAQTIAALSTAGCRFLECAIRFRHAQPVTKYRAEGTSNNFEGQPILSPEGVLYARSRNYVFHVSRTLTGGSSTYRNFGDELAKSSATAFVSPSHIHVLPVRIPETGGLIINSGQSISLPGDFQIRRGARVVFRVGSPQEKSQ